MPKKPREGNGIVANLNDKRDRKEAEKISQLTGYQVFDSNDDNLENFKSVYYYTPFNSNRIYQKKMGPSEDGNLKEYLLEMDINIELRYKDKWKEKKKKERKEKYK